MLFVVHDSERNQEVSSSLEKNGPYNLISHRFLVSATQSFLFLPRGFLKNGESPSTLSNNDDGLPDIGDGWTISSLYLRASVSERLEELPRDRILMALKISGSNK